MTTPLRIGILIGHSIATPLEAAVEMAKSAANDFLNSELALELWVDSASVESIRRFATEKIEVLLYYGHGTEDGKLIFVDGIHDFNALSVDDELSSFWSGLQGLMLMACHSHQFARALPCPWLAFGDEILRDAPKGFVHAFTAALKNESVASSIQTAHQSCKKAMDSNFADDLTISAAAWPDRMVAAGTPQVQRGSPILLNREETDIASVSLDGKLYPEHDPFVGRLKDLAQLFSLPSPDSDGPLVQRYWVSGDAGIGKSALLRQHACNVRDMAFADAGEPVWLMHAYCMNCVQPKDVERKICEKAQRLYQLPDEPESLYGLFKQLARIGGVHVWILDDLTYLRPEFGKEQDATHVAQTIAETAKTAAVALQLVVSARFSGPLGWEALKVTHLTETEALNLAARVRHHAQLGMTDQDAMDARQLFQRCGMSTVHFKRALLLASVRQISFREMAVELETVGALDAIDEEEFSKRMVEVEVRQLDEVATKHGFNYRGFLEIYWPLILRAGYFSAQELIAWFPENFKIADTKFATDRAYQTGLAQLTRLGFVATRKEPFGDVYYLPPNQRTVMKALAAGDDSLTQTIAFRAPASRLSLALERLDKGDDTAIVDIRALESDYQSHISDAAVAEVVIQAMRVRADMAAFSGNTEAEVKIYDEISARFQDREEPVLVEQVAMALVNKGFALGQLERSEEAIAVYDELVSRLGDREELALMAQVGMALVNKGVVLGQLDRSEEEIAVYDELVSRLGDREELALMEASVKALFNKGLALGQLDCSEEAIPVYDELVSRVGDREHLALIEKVADALLNKGVGLAQLVRSEEEIAVYDELVSRLGDREELGLIEKVAMALLNKGVSLGQLDRLEEAIAVYDEVVSRVGDREDLALIEKVAMALLNKGGRLGQLDRSEEAIAVYDELVSRVGDREDLALIEKVAMALYNKGVSLGQLDRSEEAIAVYDELVSRLGDREELALMEQGAKALVYKGVSLGQLDRSEEAIAVYDEVVSRVGDREDLALMEQVAMALVYKGVSLGQLHRLEEEVAVYDELVSRVGDREELALMKQVAMALLKKAASLALMGDVPQGTEVAHDVIRRYGDRNKPELAEQASKARQLLTLLKEADGKGDCDEGN